jgi:uncharacterized protein with FMN-binding domain
VRRLTLWIVSTVAALVLLFSYHTSTEGFGSRQAAALAPANPGSASTSTAPPTPGSSSSSNDSSSNGSGSSTSTSTSGTFTGSTVDTRWGPVQVQVTVAGGKITDVQATVYPQDNPRDQEINAYALPVLHDEAISAQSAQIDAVSGATVTSDGYIESLQAAIDAANLKS